MNPSGKDKISNKLDKLEEYLKYLQKIKQDTESETQFLGNFELFGSGERYLQLSIQSIIDVVHLILIESDIKRPEDNYKAVDAIVRNDVLSEELGEKLKSMIGLRNVLVHEYGDIDRSKIYNIINKDLKDLEGIHGSIKEYLSNLKKPN